MPSALCLVLIHGGVTFAWVNAAIEVTEQGFAQLDKLSAQLLILQAELDSVIDNDAQNQYCAQMKQLGNGCVSGQPVVIAGAKHELFLETDDKRNKVMNLIYDFLAEPTDNELNSN